VICYNVLHCSRKAASPLVLECYEWLLKFPDWYAISEPGHMGLYPNQMMQGYGHSSEFWTLEYCFKIKCDVQPYCVMSASKLWDTVTFKWKYQDIILEGRYPGTYHFQHSPSISLGKGTCSLGTTQKGWFSVEHTISKCNTTSLN
jgi:hypothetical protein